MLDRCLFIFFRGVKGFGLWGYVVENFIVFVIFNRVFGVVLLVIIMSGNLFF